MFFPQAPLGAAELATRPYSLKIKERRMSGTYTNLLLHLVFSTKNRVPLIDSQLQPRLYEYLGGIIRNKNGMLCAIGGMPDHVHLLVRLHQDLAISSLIRDLKSSSSGWIHEHFAHLSDFRWQEGYGAFSVSQSQLDKVDQYIRHQAEHHQNRDFTREFIAFLDKQAIAFDPEIIGR
jgi:REP element-mobilizing transposase RayT